MIRLFEDQLSLHDTMYSFIAHLRKKTNIYILSISQDVLKYSVYVRVDILLPFGQHMHDSITSLRGDVSVHKAISIPPLFIEVPVLSKENSQLCICV